MTCDGITLGRREPCKDNVGGIKALYFANFDATLFKEANEAGGVITDFGTPTTPYDLYKYELRSSGHNLEDAGETSGENGTSFHTATITAILKKIDAVSREELQIASFGRPHVFVEDYNGNFLLVGLENGCDVTVSQVTGSAMGELSGYNLTIVAQEREMSKLVEPTIIDDDTNTSVTEGA